MVKWLVVITLPALVAACSGGAAAPVNPVPAPLPAASVNASALPESAPPPRAPLSPISTTYFSSSRTLWLEGMAVAGTDEIVLAGSVSGDVTWGSTNASTMEPRDARRRIFLGKLDVRKEQKWAKVAAFSDGTLGNGVSAVAAGPKGTTVFAAEYHEKLRLDHKDILLPAGKLTSALVGVIDAQGKVRFTQAFGSETDTLTPAGVAADAEGNVFIAGDFKGRARFDQTILQEDRRSVFVAKLDRDGKVLWARSFGNTCYTTATALAADGAGAVYVGGAFCGSLDIGGTRLKPGGRETGFLVKLDRDGRTLWARAFNDAGPTIVRAIAVRREVAVASHRWPEDWDTRHGLIIDKMDVDGHPLWTRALGGQGAEARAVALGPEGSVAVCGSSRSAHEFAGTTVEKLTGAFVATFTDGGDPAGIHVIGGQRSEYCVGIAYRPSGTILAAGRASPAAFLVELSP
ncbi:MAG: hypothetical protein QM820_59770 [Minicystis sp.]